MKKPIHYNLALASLILVALFSRPAPAQAAESASLFSKGTIDIGIVARDPARTAAFLTNAIGFTEVKGFSVTSDLGKKIGLIDGYPVEVRMFALTETEPATKVKLLSFPKASATQPDQKYIHSTLGIRYLTLYVNDMTRALERLKVARVPFLGETPLELSGGNYIVVVQDPDGNFIELIGPMKK